MIEKKKKKKRIVVEQIPVFDHSKNSFIDAIGVNADAEIKEKMSEIGIKNPNVTKLSQIVEIFYENFSKIELAVIFARSLNNKPATEEETKF